MTPHADAARDKLRTDALRDYTGVHASASQFGRTIVALRSAADLDAALEAAGNLILSAEALGTATAAVVKSARAALKAVMESTNCPAVELPAHRILLAERACRAIVIDASAVPDQFWITPEPERRIDLDRLTDARMAGPVPGTELTNAGEHTLRICARERGKRRAA